MPRKNLSGSRSGPSERFTIRLSPSDCAELETLAGVWQTDRSDAVRRAVQEVASNLRRQRREQLRAELPTLTLAELRVHARQRHIAGRSKMSKKELQDAICARL
ncbi:MAG: hypothetical protein ACI9WU_000341 [Myxococcota bacterium]|jgi:hypothetical protein